MFSGVLKNSTKILVGSYFLKNHSPPQSIVSRENDAGKTKLYGHGLTRVKLIN